MKALRRILLWGGLGAIVLGRLVLSGREAGDVVPGVAWILLYSGPIMVFVGFIAVPVLTTLLRKRRGHHRDTEVQPNG